MGRMLSTAEADHYVVFSIRLRSPFMHLNRTFLLLHQGDRQIEVDECND